MASVTGGGKAAQVLARIGSQIAKAKAVKVGFLAGATYPDGTPVAMVAAINNFGAPRARIPPRPFFSNMIEAKKAEWGPACAQLLVDNDYNAELTLEQMGQGISGQLRQSIADTMAPALSPVTLMLRKMKSQDQNLVVTGKTVGEAARRVQSGESVGGVSTKPLVETGHLINSVDYEVKA